MRRTFWVALTCASAIGFAAMMSGCGSSSANGNYTYNTSSTAKAARRGAKAGESSFGTWTFSDGNLTATIARTSGGVVQYTITVPATCAAPSSDFGFQLCTIKSGSTCAAGAVACPADALPSSGDTFFLKTVEGIALFALVGGGEELHAGIVQGSCSTAIAGDYLFSHLGVGSEELFGLYNLNSDLTQVIHADFGVRATSSSGSPLPKEAFYSTGDAGGLVTVTGASCTNGVWTIPTGGGNIHATLTESGLFLLDQGGDGGILSFKVSNAATLADISGKSLKGIAFPDNGGPQPIAVTLGTATATDVTATVKFGTISGTTITVGDTGMSTIKVASSQTADPDLTAVPATQDHAYSDNTHFQPLYANIGAIPGVFYIPPTGGDVNSGVFMNLAKLGGKIVGFGTVFNDRSSNGHPVTTALPNTGNFIIFE